MSKFYCYVDESGRGTSPFFVAVVVVANERDTISLFCEKAENESRKGRIKWQKTKYDRRLAYLRMILGDSRFIRALFFSFFDQVEDYDLATVIAITRVIDYVNPMGAKKVEIFVDGLSDKQQRNYSVHIRQQTLSFINIRGVVRDESNALIRLADALAGFVNDAQCKQSQDILELFLRAQKSGVIIQV